MIISIEHLNYKMNFSNIHDEWRTTMKKFKQITALAAVILWGMLILTTLIVAFIDTEECRILFKGLVFTDIVLPVVAYAIMFLSRLFNNRDK